VKTISVMLDLGANPESGCPEPRSVRRHGRGLCRVVLDLAEPRSAVLNIARGAESTDELKEVGRLIARIRLSRNAIDGFIEGDKILARRRRRRRTDAFPATIA
jgi:fatty acid/phospholipid biosynthesis enzyme